MSECCCNDCKKKDNCEFMNKIVADNKDDGEIKMVACVWKETI
jgi:hypothetical protein